jgi:hypothetical protein
MVPNKIANPITAAMITAAIYPPTGWQLPRLSVSTPS